MWPCYRLLEARWATITELKSDKVSRQEVIDANEMLDAKDEALEELRKRPHPK